MKIIKFFIPIGILMLIIALSFNSCYYDNEQELYPNDTSNSCDSLNVTYAVQIKPIFDSKCISCHGSAGSQQLPLLDAYNLAHEYAVMPDNKLLEYINSGHQSQTFTTCEKAQITKWVNTGAN